MTNRHPGSDVDVDVDRRGGRTEVMLRGVLDVHTSPDLRRALPPKVTASSIDVDLSALTFIDSSGLTALLHLHERCARDGGQMVVSAVSRPVQRVLEITGLEQILEVR